MENNIIEEYFNYDIVFKLLIWMGVNFLGYLFGNLLLRPIKCTCMKCIKKYIVLDEEDVFEMEYHNKTNEKKAKDFESFLLYASFHFYFSNVFTRLDYRNPIQLIYILFYLGAIVVFGILGRVKGLQTSLSPSSAKKWPIASWITYSLSGLAVLALLGYHIYLSYIEKIIFYYLLSILGIVIYYIGLYYMYIKNDPDATLHVHHWYIGHLLCMYFRFDYIISNLAFMVLYGIFTQGIVNYGPASIFDH